jgi:DNA polymerase-3 subunit delta
MANGEKKMVNILAGENWLGVKQALDGLVARFVEQNGELAVEKVDASEVSLDEITGVLGTQSLLMPKKLCVIYDLSKNKDAVVAIEQILSLGANGMEIILVEGKLDKRSAYYKTLKKQPGFSEFEELDEQGAVKWLIEQAKQLDATLSRGDAQYLYSRVGGSQSRLHNELKKLVDFEPKITKQTIDELTEPTPSSSIFDLLSAAFSGDKKRAVRLYDDQRQQKVEPQRILGMLGWQMHIVAMVKSAKDTSPAELAKKASINPYVIQKSSQIASRLDRDQTKFILSELVNIDWSIKNKSIDADDAIKNLLVRIGE